MCNEFRLKLPLDALVDEFSQLSIPIHWAGGAPNLEPRDSIRPTDPAPVLVGAPEGAELKQLRWGFAQPKGGPLINFRSDGRRFPDGRCLIPADGFYEFTDPEPPAPGSSAQKRARKTRWLFTLAGHPWFCIAGLLRPMPASDRAGEGEAWTMLTTDPGPDIAPYHARQVVVLGPDDARAWLADEAPERLLRPSPAGALHVERAPTA